MGEGEFYYDEDGHLHTLKLKTQGSRDAGVKYEMLPEGSHVKKQSATGSYLGRFWKGGRGEGEKSLGAFLLKSTCNF